MRNQCHSEEQSNVRIPWVLKQDVRSSDKVLRNRQFSFSELGENRVTSYMPRVHTPIYVFVRFLCAHINMFAY